MAKQSTRPRPPSVPVEFWQALYDAAARLRALEPWKTMYDSDFLGIIDPQTGGFLVESVLGNLGEVYALVLYREREGLNFCRRVLELEEGENLEPEEVGFQQNAIMAEFVNKGQLDAADRAVLKTVNWPAIKPARTAQVSFRSYRPHFAPWHIDAEEARLLTLGLDRMAAYYQWRQGENLCLDATPEAIPTYQQTGSPGDPDGGWKLATRPLPVFPEPVETDEFAAVEPACAQIRAAHWPKNGVWEVRLRPLPFPIMEGDRPYYANIGLVVDAESAFILASEIMRPAGSESRQTAEVLVKAIQFVQAMPAAIHVLAKDAGGTLKKACEFLKIPLKTRPRLPAVEQVAQSLVSFMDR